MSFIVELSSCGSVSVCRKNGSEIRPKSKLGQDLLDCSKSGDCEPACHYLLERHKPEFRIVKQIDGEYQNVLASLEDKQAICHQIYFESEADFTDESICDLFLIWEVGAGYSNYVYA
jgi:hypothetical protein